MILSKLRNSLSTSGKGHKLVLWVIVFTMLWFLSHCLVADFVPRLDAWSWWLFSEPVDRWCLIVTEGNQMFLSSLQMVTSLDPEARDIAYSLRSPNAGTDFASEQVRYASKPNNLPSPAHFAFELWTPQWSF